MKHRLSLTFFAASFLLSGCGTLLGLDETEEYQANPSQEPQDAGPDADSFAEVSVGPDADPDDAGPAEDADGSLHPPGDATSDLDAAPDPDANGADVPADWGPLTLPGLVLWLDPTKGLTLNNLGGVKEWADQSPRQHNASQTTPELCPKPAPLSLGGRDGVGFPGDHRSLVVVDNDDINFGKEDFLMEVVFRYEDAPADNSCWNVGQAILAKVPETPPFAGVVVFGNIPVASGVESKSIGGFLVDGLTLRTIYACNDNRARLVGLRRSGHTVELRINGVQEATASPPGDPVDVSASGRNLLIGGRETASQCANGVIGDIVVVKGPTSQHDLETLEKWFLVRYGL